MLLSNYLIEHIPADKIVVVAGGFVEATTVKSFDPAPDLSKLEADHVHMESIVMSARDIDVLVPLLAHYDQVGCSFQFSKAGTSKHPRYIPVYGIRRQIPFNQVSAILASHDITEYDSVSQFAGHSEKITCHFVFQQQHNYLTDFGKGHYIQYSEGTAKSVSYIYSFI